MDSLQISAPATNVCADVKTVKNSSKSEQEVDFEEVLKGMKNSTETENTKLVVSEDTEDTEQEMSIIELLENLVGSLDLNELPEEILQSINGLSEDQIQLLYNILSEFIGQTPLKMDTSNIETSKQSHKQIDAINVKNINGAKEISDVIKIIDNVDVKDIKNQISDLISKLDLSSNQISLNKNLVNENGQSLVDFAKNFLSKNSSKQINNNKNFNQEFKSITNTNVNVKDLIQKNSNYNEQKANISVSKVQIQETENANITQTIKGLSKTASNVNLAQDTNEFEDILSSYSSQSNLANVQNSGTNSVSETVKNNYTEGNSVIKQITPSIIESISESSDIALEKQIIIKLNPVELGEVNVKISKIGDEIKVTIGAIKDATNNLINERSLSLLSSLQNVNANVKDVVIVNPNSEASEFMNHFGSFESNGEEQGQANYSSKHSQNSQTVNEDLEQPEQELLREAKLWQTV